MLCALRQFQIPGRPGALLAVSVVGAVMLAACGEAGEDDAERAASEAGDAARSAGEAVEEGWESGDDERSQIAKETGEAVNAVTAHVRAEWAAAEDERRAALDSAGDHVEAAGSAVTQGLDAAADAYARTLDEGRDRADFRGRAPDFDAFASQDDAVTEEPLDGSVKPAGEAGLDGAPNPEGVDREDGEREYVPGHALDVEVHPCAEHDHETCDHTEEEHARCTPERG